MNTNKFKARIYNTDLILSNELASQKLDEIKNSRLTPDFLSAAVDFLLGGDTTSILKLKRYIHPTSLGLLTTTAMQSSTGSTNEKLETNTDIQDKMKDLIIDTVKEYLLNFTADINKKLATMQLSMEKLENNTDNAENKVSTQEFNITEISAKVKEAVSEDIQSLVESTVQAKTGLFDKSSIETIIEEKLKQNSKERETGYKQVQQKPDEPITQGKFKLRLIEPVESDATTSDLRSEQYGENIDHIVETKELVSEVEKSTQDNVDIDNESPVVLQSETAVDDTTKTGLFETDSVRSKEVEVSTEDLSKKIRQNLLKSQETTTDAIIARVPEEIVTIDKTNQVQILIGEQRRQFELVCLLINENIGAMGTIVANKLELVRESLALNKEVTKEMIIGEFGDEIADQVYSTILYDDTTNKWSKSRPKVNEIKIEEVQTKKETIESQSKLDIGLFANAMITAEQENNYEAIQAMIVAGNYTSKDLEGVLKVETINKVLGLS